MTEQEQIKLGREIFLRGGSYKDCKNANTLRGYTNEERITRCGYTLQSWNKDGQGLGQVRMKTVRSGLDNINTNTGLFEGEK